MSVLFMVLYATVVLYWNLLVARIIIEMVVSFSRDWRPRGSLVVVFEVIMTFTDPPVRLLRRVIPPLRLGAVALDMSVLVLFFVLLVVRWLLVSAAV